MVLPALCHPRRRLGCGSSPGFILAQPLAVAIIWGVNQQIGNSLSLTLYTLHPPTPIILPFKK